MTNLVASKKESSISIVNRNIYLTGAKQKLVVAAVAHSFVIYFVVQISGLSCAGLINGTASDHLFG